MHEHLQKTLPSIISQYHAAHDLRLVPIQIDRLRPMLEERGFADRFVWEAYDFPARNIAAQVSFYTAQMGLYGGEGDYARIQYSSHLNFCWQRFAICKEMYHSLLDTDHTSRTSNLSELLKLSEMLVSDATKHISNFDPHTTEQEAEILALETLFPLELRLVHEKAYSNGLISDHQLALRYRIPEEYARLGMYEHYLKTIKQIRGKLVDL